MWMLWVTLIISVGMLTIGLVAPYLAGVGLVLGLCFGGLALYGLIARPRSPDEPRDEGPRT